MNKAEVSQQRELKSNQSGQMKAVGLAEELNPVPPVEATSSMQSGSTLRLTNASVLHGAPPKLDQHPKNASYPSQIHAGQRMLQFCYMNDLQSQIERRQKHQAQDQQYRLLTERLDQILLIQEIACQKAEQFQQKQEKTKHYKKALDKKVEDKMFTASPNSPPDKPRLTRCETAIRRAESRERAKKVFQMNFSVATQKKKEEMQSRQLQLEEEREMLQRTKMELMQDKASHFEKKHYIRKSLEDEWSRSAELKHRREDEEKRFLRSAGQLLVDKLEECRRCCRCKRRMANRGETNIWKDSRYLSGSQFMI